MNFLAHFGYFSIKRTRELCYLTAIVSHVLFLATKPRYWNRSLRKELSHQILFAGIETIWIVCFVAIAVGISMITQYLVWFQRTGEPTALDTLLLTVLVREVVPILTNLIVIVRYGAALTTELGNMKIAGEVNVLEAQGIDPFIYLVIPRVLGVTISVLCLNVFFIIVSFGSGYFFSLFLHQNIIDPVTFLESIFVAIEPLDLLHLIIKSFFSALFASSICCIEGLSVDKSSTEVPKATIRALGKSVIISFAFPALVSLITYY
jgi:phospholipid/cholesterol/gamma-HCH transport system permease protein